MPKTNIVVDMGTFKDGIQNNGAHFDKKTNMGSSDYDPSALTSDYIITVDTSGAARNVIISTEDRDSGSPTNVRTFIIEDIIGNAAANPITISLETAGNINGAPTFVISSDHGAVNLEVDGTNGYIVMTYLPIANKDAELYKYASISVTTIDTADVFHALQDLSEGLSSGWTFAVGTRGTDIIIMATYNGNASTLITTTAPHNLAAGDYITITGTTNYNSPYKVLSTPSATTFEINKAWDGNNDATGTYSRGDSFVADTSSKGIYDFSWSITAEPAAINKLITGAIMINDGVCDKCRARDYFTKTQDETGGSGALITIANGDHVCMVFKNISDTTNFTIRHANFRIHRIRQT